MRSRLLRQLALDVRHILPQDADASHLLDQGKNHADPHGDYEEAHTAWRYGIQRPAHVLLQHVTRRIKIVQPWLLSYVDQSLLPDGSREVPLQSLAERGTWLARHQEVVLRDQDHARLRQDSTVLRHVPDQAKNRAQVMPL